MIEQDLPISTSNNKKIKNKRPTSWLFTANLAEKTENTFKCLICNISYQGLTGVNKHLKEAYLKVSFTLKIFTINLNYFL